MRDADGLRALLRRIDGRGYKAYKDLKGGYALTGFELHVDHVQGDPFAAPSRLRADVPAETAGLPAWALASPAGRTATADFLTRAFARACAGGARRGSGKSGLLEIEAPRQEVLERTSVLLHDGAVEARFRAGLPARGRTVLGHQAEALLLEDVPHAVEAALRFAALDADALRRHVEAVEDQHALRAELARHGLVAFVGDGARLPRRSGIDPRPMRGDVVAFRSPDSLAVEMDLPHAGRVRGLGVREGVTLIVGGGYHGKSTLLNAIELGVYDHPPGDGRELVATRAGAVKIRAEDGRRVEKVDISGFIDNLPFGRDTRAFSSEDASGSTSQAANILEALEAGADALLMDEDTSATNFMIRDHRMQALVSKDKEPITPFLDRVRRLHEERGVSTVLVVGGAGDYFDVADTVVQMDEYEPRDVTARAKKIAAEFADLRRREEDGPFRVGDRRPRGRSLDSSRGRRDENIAVKDLRSILFGRTRLDLSAVEQLVEPAQTRAIGRALLWLRPRLDGTTTLAAALDALEEALADGGLDALARNRDGELARPRRFEIAAALNRLRTLAVAD